MCTGLIPFMALHVLHGGLDSFRESGAWEKKGASVDFSDKTVVRVKTLFDRRVSIRKEIIFQQVRRWAAVLWGGKPIPGRRPVLISYHTESCLSLRRIKA